MMTSWQGTRRLGRVAPAFVALIVGMLALVVAAVFADPVSAQTKGSNVRPPSSAVKTRVPPGNLPVTASPQPSSPDLWRGVRHGLTGKVSIPNKQAGMLIQSEGEAWRQLRNGKLSEYGAWLLLAVIVILGLFYAVRGRIRIEAGASGKTVERFNFIDRFAHWLTAVSFIVLGLTGLNLLYGRDVLLPVLGPEVFSAITIAGKYAHNFVAFAFMVGIVLMLVLWARQNLPDRYDVKWILKGGGMFTRHSHPLARKFNAGQKLLFWAVIWGGAAVSVTGIYLMFPLAFATIQGMQELQIWHAALSLVLIAVIIAHIYIGTMGMVGAFDAMGTGEVDENWAREHHGAWVAEIKGEPTPKAASHD